MTNRVISRASQRNIIGSRGSERATSQGYDQGGIFSPKSSGNQSSNKHLKTEGANSSFPQTPNAKGRGGGILKKTTNFQDQASIANKIANDAPLSDSEDELDRQRSKQPSALDAIHKGLGTKQYKSSLKRKQVPKKSSRLEVFEMERTGKKSVTFKQMKDSVQLLSHKKFILTRFVGHKSTMEHGHRWRLYLESSKNNACWICEKWNYTLFFWTRPFGEKDQIKMSSDQL